MSNIFERMEQARIDALQSADHTMPVTSSPTRQIKTNADGEKALSALLGEIPEGQRNNAMAKFAGVLRKQGLDEFLIRHILISVNSSNRIGLPVEEVASIARSISQYSPQQMEYKDEIKPQRGLVPMSECVAETIAFMEEVRNDKIKLVTTGVKWIDREFGGIMPGELIVIGARASVGKSALGMQIAFSAATKQTTTAYFSLEMSRVSLTARKAFKNSGTTFGEYLKDQGKDVEQASYNKIRENIKGFSSIPLYISETPQQTIQRIKEELLRSNEQYGFVPNLIVIDHLHLMMSDDHRESNYQKVTKISNELKSLALELQIPVIVLAQLNRDSAKEEREPSDHDLRDSGAIEQDADRIIIVHRPKRFDITWQERDFDPAVLLITKNRNMGTGRIECWFEKSSTEFTEKTTRGEEWSGSWTTEQKTKIKPT